MSTALVENAGYKANLFDFAPHTHNCYEIIYLKQGILRVQIEGKIYRAVGPSLIFLSKLETHSLKVEGNVYERYWLCISSARASNLIRNYKLLTLLSNRHEDFCHVLDVTPFYDEANRIFSSCVAEFNADLPFADEKHAALLSELLVIIYRLNPALFANEDNKTVSTIWKIQCRFEKEYANNFTLANLSKEYHMSPSYLSHLFKRVTGYAPMSYLNKCRLSEARRLLSETDMSVTDVVYATGFSDSSNFSRLFKREIGLSPNEYKKQSK